MANTDSHRRLEQAVEMIEAALMCDGAQHKQWYLDQILRVLLADGYERHRQRAAEKDEDWEEGIEP